jgi:hypothetical protein
MKGANVLHCMYYTRLVDPKPYTCGESSDSTSHPSIHCMRLTRHKLLNIDMQSNLYYRYNSREHTVRNRKSWNINISIIGKVYGFICHD